MTKRLTFQGYSDDTFACEGPGIDVDHDNCASGKPIYMLVKRPNSTEGLIVSGQYAPGPAAGWIIGVAPADWGVDEHHIPDWPMRFARTDREYSPMLLVDAPDDIVVRLELEP